MGLILKAILGKTAVSIAGKEAHKVEKKVKKSVRRTKRTIALMTLSFFAGAFFMGWLIYGRNNAEGSLRAENAARSFPLFSRKAE